jgi:hypothetical protein
VGDPPSYDRYAYVRNNSLKYTDPSGHNLNCGQQGSHASPEDCADADPDGDGKVTLPTPEPDVDLTQDGQEIYGLYEQWRDTPGWWNNNMAGNLTLAQFLGLWILFESTVSDPEMHLALANMLATVIAQNLYVGGWNPAVCIAGGTCINAVFNFIGANRDGSSGLLSGPRNQGNQLWYKNHENLGSPGVIRGLMSSLGTAALDPASLITKNRWAGPSIWGNYNGAEDIYSTLQTNRIPFSLEEDSAYYIYGDFIVLSVNQFNYWDPQVDLNLRTR